MSTATAHMTTTTRTTIPIASDRLAQIDSLVASGDFSSRANCIDLALRRLFWDLEDAAMHAEFEEAAKDPAFVAESIAMAEEAAQGSWEALLEGEADEQRE